MKYLLIAAAFVVASTTGAFAQMSHDGTHGADHMAASPMIEGMGTINGLDMEKRTVNVTHEPIGALGWPSMTMDFAVAEGVDMSKLAKGEAVMFSLAKGSDGIYMIDALKDR